MTMNYPPIVFVMTLALMALSTWVGDALRKRVGIAKDDPRNEAAGLMASAILTLLFLLIGFTFSMATNRYDLRKTCEQADAIAIGTMYSRADLLAPADAGKVQALLKKYLDHLMLLYTAGSPDRAREIRADVVRLQAELWATLRPALEKVPPPLLGALVQGLNDVVSAQRSSQAAWQNRIPVGAWALIITISMGCCWLIGFRARRTDWLAFMVVPVAVAISLFLIAEIDSPRGGVIRVVPNNLTSVAQSLAALPIETPGR
jgi:FtsH-binding integral membrane protein